MDLPNPLVVDEGEFSDVIRKMVNTEPEPLKKIMRRRNPERDPRYLPVFDFTRTIPVTSEVLETVKETDRHNREYKVTHKQEKKR